MPICRKIRTAVFQATLFGLACCWVLAHSDAAGSVPTITGSQTTSAPLSFEQWLREMRITDGPALELKLSYADYLLYSCGFPDRALAVADEVIRATTQPCELLQGGYFMKMNALRWGRRLDDFLAACDGYVAAFSNDATTFTYYRVPIPRNRMVEVISLFQKSAAYEQMEYFEKALEHKEKAMASLQTFVNLLPEKEATVGRLEVVTGRRELAELCEKVGRYEEALRHLKELQAYLSVVSNLEGVADPKHPDEAGLLRIAVRLRDEILPAAIERVQRKLGGNTAKPAGSGWLSPDGSSEPSLVMQPFGNSGCGSGASTTPTKPQGGAAAIAPPASRPATLQELKRVALEASADARRQSEVRVAAAAMAATTPAATAGASGEGGCGCGASTTPTNTASRTAAAAAACGCGATSGTAAVSCCSPSDAGTSGPLKADGKAASVQPSQAK